LTNTVHNSEHELDKGAGSRERGGGRVEERIL
jgi:hypothetical protein